MKIAVITTHGSSLRAAIEGSSWAGSEELWAAMVDQALDEGHHVTVSIYDWPTTPAKILRLEQKGARVLKRALPNPSRSSYVKNALLRRLARLPKQTTSLISSFKEVFRFNPDVVCLSQGTTYDSVFMYDLVNWLYTSSTPYVVICQANKEDYYDNIPRQEVIEFFARASRIVFVSSRNLKVAERQLASSISNAVVVQNPVNISDLKTVPWPSPEPIKMAVVARLAVFAKNQDSLFEALSSEAWRSRNWRLNLFGEGQDKDYLEALAQHYKISNRVTFRGHVADVRAIWKENHILVLPSRMEGTPLSLIEAMLCGRPAVVTDVGGNAEWVEEGRTGYVADAPTSKLVGAALERAWLDRNNWEQRGLQAHESALQKFDKAPGRTLLKIVLEAQGHQKAQVNSTTSAESRPSYEAATS